MKINDMVEILLIEDNPYDIEMTLNVLKENNLANNIHVVKDGEEALEFYFWDREIQRTGY